MQNIDDLVELHECPLCEGGAMHDGNALMLIGLALVCIGIGIWIIVWINKRMNR